MDRKKQSTLKQIILSAPPHLALLKAQQNFSSIIAFLRLESVAWLKSISEISKKSSVNNAHLQLAEQLLLDLPHLATFHALILKAIKSSIQAGIGQELLPVFQASRVYAQFLLRLTKFRHVTSFVELSERYGENFRLSGCDDREAKLPEQLEKYTDIDSIFEYMATVPSQFDQLLINYKNWYESLNLQYLAENEREFVVKDQGILADVMEQISEFRTHELAERQKISQKILLDNFLPCFSEYHEAKLEFQFSCRVSCVSAVTETIENPNSGFMSFRSLSLDNIRLRSRKPPPHHRIVLFKIHSQNITRQMLMIHRNLPDKSYATPYICCEVYPYTSYKWEINAEKRLTSFTLKRITSSCHFSSKIPTEVKFAADGIFAEQLKSQFLTS